MPNPILLPRLAAMIRLALRPEGQTPDDRLRSERLAQAAGLSGAEIDAAKLGRSFDVGANAAIGLALAVASSVEAKVEKARRQSRASGLTLAEIKAVEREAARMLQNPPVG